MYIFCACLPTWEIKYKGLSHVIKKKW
jgi:hypothetical protein